VRGEEGVGWSGVMKKRRENPHAVALGRLCGLVRSEAKRRGNRENGRKGGLVKSARSELPGDATPDAHGRADEDARRRGERGGRLDSRPFRISGYRPW
jgi:hypothetical protein